MNENFVGASTVPLKICLVHGVIVKMKLKKVWKLVLIHQIENAGLACRRIYSLCNYKLSVCRQFSVIDVFTFFLQGLLKQVMWSLCLQFFVFFTVESQTRTGRWPLWNLQSQLGCEFSMLHFFFLDLIKLIPLCWSVYL